MARYSKCFIVASITIGLSACGGGGGSGGVASTPPPPPATSAAALISAPAIAAAPNANLFPEAAVGGPTIQSHPTTVFPLLQTSVSIRPGVVAADTATINGGATLSFGAPGTSYQLNVGNPALGVSNANLVATPSGVYEANLGSGAKAFLLIANPATSNLSWTSYGFWSVAMSSGARAETAFATGYETPTGSVPTTGTATYFGSVVGEAFHPQAGQENGVGYSALSGDARLDANFATGNITGSLTNMIATGFDGSRLPWNTVSLLATISGGQFTGTSAATSAPNNIASLLGTATGTIAGRFFGPNAQELGAVWTLFDGTSSAIGSIGASSQNPSCAGCWDY